MTRNHTTATRIGAGVLASGALLAGGSLLLNMNGASASGPAPAVAAAAAADAPADVDQAFLLGFLNAGYDYDDAVALGKLWNNDDVADVKATAGRKLLAGETLPIAAGSAPTAPLTAADKKLEAEAKATEAYMLSETNQNDPEQLDKLAALWNVDWYEAKVMAGEMLLAGKTLPVVP